MKNLKCNALGVSLCLLITACGSSASQSESNQQVTFQTVEQVSVLAKPNNPINAPAVYILRSLSDWNDFWNTFALTMPTSMPTIDFAQNQFIAVVDGVQATGGHSIAITAVQNSSTGVVVSAVETSPGPSCVTTQWVNQPIHVVMTPTFSGSATLNLSQKVTACN